MQICFCGERVSLLRLLLCNDYDFAHSSLACKINDDADDDASSKSIDNKNYFWHKVNHSRQIYFVWCIKLIWKKETTKVCCWSEAARQQIECIDRKGEVQTVLSYSLCIRVSWFEKDLYSFLVILGFCLLPVLLLPSLEQPVLRHSLHSWLLLRRAVGSKELFRRGIWSKVSRDSFLFDTVHHFKGHTYYCCDSSFSLIFN